MGATCKAYIYEGHQETGNTADFCEECRTFTALLETGPLSIHRGGIEHYELQCGQCSMVGSEEEEKRPQSEEAIEHMIAELEDAIERVDALRKTVAQVKQDGEWRPPGTVEADSRRP